MVTASMVAISIQYVLLEVEQQERMVVALALYTKQPLMEKK
jgi:hypothetical protein